MKQCVNCLQWKDESEFNWRYRALGIRHGMCPDCQEELRDHRDQKHGDQQLERVSESAREIVYNYLLTHPCAACGESDPRVLEFHHAGGKGWIISNVVGGGNDLMAIQAEITNCVVLCANCCRKISKGEPARLKGRK